VCKAIQTGQMTAFFLSILLKPQYNPRAKGLGGQTSQQNGFAHSSILTLF